MRAFYLTYPIVDALRPQLTWTHYRLLLRVEKESVRDFYVDECITNNWFTRQLERQINSFYYERLLSSKDKKPVMKEADQKSVPAKPEDLIKDPYVLEFLDLKVHRMFLENSKNIFASKYKLYLPSEEELKKELERELIEIEKKVGD